jgi:pSer/pThr/pTyr-binding forkhead associated (FHA) protein
VLAKIIWTDPLTRECAEFLLAEQATAIIGRADGSDIVVKEQHVSRQHAVISYRDGVFLIADSGSANGVFVNDTKIEQPYPLVAGDAIRLYVPELRFESMFVESNARENTTLITAAVNTGKGRLIVSNGPQEGESFYLLRSKVHVGRAVASADWEICLQDASVSRPHARLELIDGVWMVSDLGSANGTRVNNVPITEKGRALRDGDLIAFGGSLVVFRVG